MVTTKLNLSMTEPQVRQIYAKQGDTGRVLDITLDQTPEDGTLRILRPDGVEVTSEAVTGGEVSESGETVTFDSLTEADVTELTVGIEPVQDLNGYDAPWVGGAGKNKLPLTLAILKANNTSGTWNGNVYTHNNGCVFTVGTNDGVTATTISVTGTASGGPCNFLLTNTTTHEELLGLRLNGCPSGGSGSTYFIGGYNLTDGTNAFLPDMGSGTTIPSTLSGKSFRIYIGILQGVNASGKVFYPMAYNSADGSAWQPYSNICPITGHDEVTVTRTGKNLFDKANGAKNLYVGGGNVTGSGGTLLCFLAKKGTQYTISMTGGNRTNLYYYDTTSLDDIVSGITLNLVTLSATKPYTFIAEHDAVYCYYADTNFQQTVADSCMVELGSTATTYEPYQGSTYTTSLGQTVYGGTLDMVSGLLTVDKGYYKVTGNESGGYLVGRNNNGNRIDFPVDGANSPQYANILSNIGTPSALVLDSNRWQVGNFCFYTTSSAKLFVTVPNEYTSFATAIAYLNSINAEFVFPLAEPVTYQLTAQQIKTLVGTNNVWASSGDIVNITFTYGGLLAELPSDATSVAGKCYCDIEQNGVSSMPFTLNVKKNERQ